jgi:hypothetical protein
MGSTFCFPAAAWNPSQSTGFHRRGAAVALSVLAWLCVGYNMSALPSVHHAWRTSTNHSIDPVQLQTESFRRTVNLVKRASTAYTITEMIIYHNGLGSMDVQQQLDEMSRVKRETGVDKVIKKDNVGRDGATHLDLRIQHYHALTNQMIFLQGQP